MRNRSRISSSAQRKLTAVGRVASSVAWAFSKASSEASARIANATAARLGLDLAFASGDIINDDGYIGERYGVVSDAGREAMRLVAETEGLILDPVYSSKAMAGLINHIRQGRIGADETVVFIHTGGLPALFAYAYDLGLD